MDVDDGNSPIVDKINEFLSQPNMATSGGTPPALLVPSKQQPPAGQPPQMERGQNPEKYRELARNWAKLWQSFLLENNVRKIFRGVT